MPSLPTSRLILATALIAACAREVPDGPYARATVIGGLDETIGGEMGIARPGDFMLTNDLFRVSVLAGRPSMGPNISGGSVVDADLQWNDPRVDGGNGRDQWNEMFPLSSMNVHLASDLSTVRIAADGTDGGPAIVRVASPSTPFLSLLNVLWPLVGMPDQWLVTDYIVEPGVPWLTMRTTVTFSETAEPVVEGEPVDYPLGGIDVVDVGLENGVVFGDFWLAGGSLDVFAPGIGFDEDAAVAAAAAEGRNSFISPFEFPFVAAVGDGLSYGIVPKEGNAYVPLFTSSQTAVVGGVKRGSEDGPRFAPTDAFTYERYFLIGHGDVGSVVDQYLQVRDIPHGTVTGNVFELGTNLPLSGIRVFVFEPGAEAPWSQWTTDVRRDDMVRDGNFGGTLPVGTWEIMVHELGRADTDRFTIEVTEGSEQQVALYAPAPGTVSFEIRDERGRLVPGKLTLLRADPATQPANRQPLLGDGYIGGRPEWVVFADRGTGTIPVPDGEYIAIASRGLEYEIDVSEPFKVDARRGHQIVLQVHQSIDTSGWISADFHVHSAPSHDSGVTLDQRVRTYVCEGVEFFAATDHDVLTDFAPTVEAMGLTEWVQTSVGAETTTVELGHFLAFPLQRHWLGDVGGAFDWTGSTPTTIVETLRQQGRDAGYEPLVFVAHPRSGILGYHDQFGLNTFDGTPGAPGLSPEIVFNNGLTDIAFRGVNPLLEPGGFTMAYDALELFTGKELFTIRTPLLHEIVDLRDQGEGTMYDWLLRTLEEQQGLEDGTYKIQGDVLGSLDDWMALTNLGYRITALGNSDTHGMTSIEAGCPRNYVMSETDSPGAIDDQAVADAVRDHRVVASYGPFVQLWIDGAIIGDQISTNGEIEITIEVQAPTWMDIDTVTLYENGSVVEQFDVTEADSTLRFLETFTRTPTQDAWYAVVVGGDAAMDPVFTGEDIPVIQLDDVVAEVLGAVPAITTIAGDLSEVTPRPRTYPITPFALTNPIWVDVGGDGWQAPGLPSWWVPTELPEPPE